MAIELLCCCKCNTFPSLCQILSTALAFKHAFHGTPYDLSAEELYSTSVMSFAKVTGMTVGASVRSHVYFA